MFPNIHQIFRLVCTVPVTSSECERSISVLRRLKTYLRFSMGDRLVCGINDAVIQKRLLAEPGLTYAKAVEIAQNAETASQGLQELRTKPEGDTTTSHSSQSEVFRTAATAVEPSFLTCYRCGRIGHTVAKCRVDKGVVCHHCCKKGHLH